MDRAGWVAGNKMNIFVQDDADASSAGARRRWHSYAGDSAKSAKLNIDFTGGGGAPTTRRYNLPTLGVG